MQYNMMMLLLAVLGYALCGSGCGENPCTKYPMQPPGTTPDEYVSLCVAFQCGCDQGVSVDVPFDTSYTTTPNCSADPVEVCIGWEEGRDGDVCYYGGGYCTPLYGGVNDIAVPLTCVLCGGVCCDTILVGTVTDEGGVGVPGVVVVVGLDEVAVTDEFGNYVAHDLPPGMQLVTFYPEDLTVVEPVTLEVTIAECEVNTLDVVLPCAGKTIEGYVTAECGLLALSCVCLTILETGQTTTSNAFGYYSFPSLDTGIYTILAEHPEGVEKEFRWLMPQCADTNLDLTLPFPPPSITPDTLPTLVFPCSIPSDIPPADVTCTDGEGNVLDVVESETLYPFNLLVRTYTCTDVYGRVGAVHQTVETQALDLIMSPVTPSVVTACNEIVPFPEVIVFDECEGEYLVEPSVIEATYPDSSPCAQQGTAVPRVSVRTWEASDVEGTSVVEGQHSDPELDVSISESWGNEEDRNEIIEGIEEAVGDGSGFLTGAPPASIILFTGDDFIGGKASAYAKTVFLKDQGTEWVWSTEALQESVSGSGIHTMTWTHPPECTAAVTGAAAAVVQTESSAFDPIEDTVIFVQALDVIKDIALEFAPIPPGLDQAIDAVVDEITDPSSDTYADVEGQEIVTVGGETGTAKSRSNVVYKREGLEDEAIIGGGTVCEAVSLVDTLPDSLTSSVATSATIKVGASGNGYATCKLSSVYVTYLVGWCECGDELMFDIQFDFGLSLNEMTVVAQVTALGLALQGAADSIAEDITSGDLDCKDDAAVEARLMSDIRSILIDKQSQNFDCMDDVFKP
ncbi:hypothetical protein KIPB_001317 [Kipferlia bialata]|uniref:Carboxypeptidase regulatory-like domain-containing protein n=1 Tax=Kipferlia bialata TaxID=797122 RepID=A0A9K3CNK6_9EUKA|nr:hypothetical protein KIPB_001317 [Kipferlia bialata]|eukprot:g1317.t1